MEKKEIFKRLWEQYSTMNPSVQKVHDLFIQEGEVVENDHIAFRTFDHDEVNIDKLAIPFINAGYIYKMDYHFEEKKLYAKHFEHSSDEKAPRIFISQLKTGSFSEFLQNTIKEAVSKIHQDILSSDEIVFAGNCWGQPSYDTYNKLRDESEYAAWLYVYGFTVNHFTVSINSLKKYDTVPKVNQLLKDNGFLINDSGGEIKGTPEQLLEQSSIKAEMIDVDFVEGNYKIPGCYYEFAKRYPDPSGKLYSGFIAKSADKIFESTDYYEK
jgi:hypothetical protein